MRRFRQTWSESITRAAAPLRVDRERGVIYGVKVLGLESENNRRYPAPALKRACQLYEGAKVNIDHPSRPEDQRSAYDRFGRLFNVRAEADGLYADLEYLKSHPMAERITESAERMPDAFGLSPNHACKYHLEGGTTIIDEITEVRHVDLVADPATTKSLSEGRTMDDMTADPVAETGEDWKQHLVNAIGALVASTDPDDHDMAKKILGMLKPAEVAAVDDDSNAEEGDGDPPADDAPADDDKKKDDDMESINLKKRAERYVKLAGLKPDERLLESLVLMKTEDAILAHLSYLQEIAKPAVEKPAAKPRSAPARMTEALAVIKDQNDYKRQFLLN